MHLIAALQIAAPDVGASAVALLQSSPSAPASSFLPGLLNQLSGLPGELVLILDDFHVIESPDVQEGLSFLLDHLPPRVHIVIASRADPPLPLARFRARGELVEIRAAELRFLPGEATAYLNDVMGLHLTPRDVALLEGRTEGWIAALQFAALSAQGRDDVTKFIGASPATIATWSITSLRKSSSVSPMRSAISSWKPASWIG